MGWAIPTKYGPGQRKGASLGGAAGTPFVVHTGPGVQTPASSPPCGQVLKSLEQWACPTGTLGPAPRGS